MAKTRLVQTRLGLIVVAMLVASGGGGLQASQPDISILSPQHKKLLVTTGAASVTGRFNPTTVASIQFLERVQVRKYIEVSTKDQKENFAKDVRGLFSENFILEQVILKTSRRGGTEGSNEYQFQRKENVDLRKFWASTAFREMLALVYDTKVLTSEVTLGGWSKRNTVVSSQEYQHKYGDTFSFAMALVPGVNIFYLRAIADTATVVAYDSVAFFYKTEIQSEPPPTAFVRQAFHTEANENQCASCHSLTLSASVKEKKSFVESECKTCHRMLISQKSSHDPASDWNCLKCHDPDASPKYQLYADQNRDAALCLKCHAEKRQDAQSNTVLHAPVATADCRKCHDSHGTRNDALVVAPVNDVCLSCHKEIATIPHPVVGHPLKGRPDPFRPGKELSCATCHNPHASENAYLLIAPKFAVCQKCHQK